MLTVLWRKPDGSEDLFTAERLERLQPDGKQGVPCLGKFRASGVVLDDVPGDSREFEIEQPFGAVFVMNDKGQTVARYMA